MLGLMRYSEPYSDVRKVPFIDIMAPQDSFTLESLPRVSLTACRGKRLEKLSRAMKEARLKLAPWPRQPCQPCQPPSPLPPY